MKFFTVIFLILISQSVFSQLVPPTKLPVCGSPMVRFSKVPVLCEGGIDLNRDFDIPAVKLDFEDIQKMFQGAESSGGGRPTTSPAQIPQAYPGPIDFDFEFSLVCQTTMVTDTNLTLLLLSNFDFELTNEFQYQTITNINWSHYLSGNTTLELKKDIFISEALDLEFPEFKISLSDQLTSLQKGEGLRLSICGGHLGQGKTCSELEVPKSRKKIKTLILVKDYKRNLERKIELSCQTKFKD